MARSVRFHRAATINGVDYTAGQVVSLADDLARLAVVNLHATLGAGLPDPGPASSPALSQDAMDARYVRAATDGGADLTGVYVTSDWVLDPHNPDNGGDLPAGVPVVQIEAP